MCRLFTLIWIPIENYTTMRSIILYLTFALILYLPSNLLSQTRDTINGFYFERDFVLPHTEVKNQGRTGTCWSFTGMSFVESEMARMGKPFVDLSEMYIVRNVYLEKADRYVRMHGHLNFAQGGALPDPLVMMDKYGALPEWLYPGHIYDSKTRHHGELEAVLKGFLDGLIANRSKRLSDKWKPAFRKIVDTYLGQVPDSFTYEGKVYTPQQFAREIVGVRSEDYVQISSTTRVPFYTSYVILVPDNWMLHRAYNVPVEQLSAIVDHALSQGYSVAWAADVSEPYFSWKNALAVLPPKPWEDLSKEERDSFFLKPRPEMQVTQALRDSHYDSYRTTDDHAMHIVGMAKDQNNRPYYLVKNSWDVHNPLRGYLYVTKAYLQLKTTALLLHKDALPPELREKLGMH